MPSPLPVFSEKQLRAGLRALMQTDNSVDAAARLRRELGLSEIEATCLVRDSRVFGEHLLDKHFGDANTLAASDSGQTVVRLSDGSFSLRDMRRIVTGHEVDPASVGVRLVGPSAWEDGTAKKLVWVQLAEVGAWKGHAAGPFEMTPTTFSEICRNFDARGLPVPLDYEHSSEQDPTSGTIPQGGAPAPGWVHRLDNRGTAGLWGLVEWLDTARKQIKAGEYAFLSPAIRFGARDSRTGAQIGARLTSVALTNQPFLTGLEGLRAARDVAPPDPAAQSVTALCRTLMRDERLPYAAALAEAKRRITMAVVGGR